MKRLTAGLITAALIFTLDGTTAFASGHCHRSRELCYPSCAYCDGPAYHCADADDDGICDAFSDSDNDGVCDHHAEYVQESRHSAYSGGHHGHRCH